MSTVLASTVMHPATITMDTITPMAERQIETLGPKDRRCVIAALCRPVLARRCERVTHLAKFRVGHFDVSRSVRVCYRRIGAQNCVIHVGTHERFDEFASRYTGTVAGKDRIIPVKESIVVKKNLTVASHPSSASTVERPTLQVVAPNATDPLRDALSAVCRDVLAGAVDGKLDRFLADLVEQNEQVDALGRRLSAAEETLRNEFNRDLAAVHDRVRAEWQELSNKNAALLRNEIVSEVTGRALEIESVEARLDQTLSSHMVDRLQDAARQSEAMGQAIRAAFADDLNSVAARLLNQLAAQSEVITVLRNRADETAAEIARLRTELSDRNKPSQMSPLRREVRSVMKSLAGFRTSKLFSFATKTG